MSRLLDQANSDLSQARKEAAELRVQLASAERESRRTVARILGLETDSAVVNDKLKETKQANRQFQKDIEELQALHLASVALVAEHEASLKRMESERNSASSLAEKRSEQLALLAADVGSRVRSDGTPF